MTLGTILAVIDGEAGSEAVVKAALALGRDFEAAVELLHVEGEVKDAMPLFGEGASGAMVEQVIENIRAAEKKRAAEARRLYDTHCVAAGLPLIEADATPVPGRFDVRFDHVIGRESDEVTRRGRLSDLVVVAKPPPEPTDGNPPALEVAMFETGRPVLMVPPDLPDPFASKIAIAWDGSREAARALGAALPMLRKAVKVEIMTAQYGSVAAKPSEVARYLGQHGIEARTWAFTPGRDPIGKELMIQCAEAGADMLVMGAYGHSRFREMVLGGATRGVIAGATLPVLLAH
ncbi:MAG: universal stress protein [Rhodospirillales bacterium]|nr:universal stress protein [Rhodospirillales bacterium]MDH3911141.1 universal stress protein [Rhodospirillales bacterium]MDH3918615.1 universal stress protein [Rhodospirillales bacterium]MDH3966857.1 universal stress protein [Rhodospirillales bacterium]